MLKFTKGESMIRKVLMTCLIAVAGSYATLGASTKIAVVDMEKVYSGYYKTQMLSARFDKQKQVYKSYSMKLKTEAEALKKGYEKLLKNAQNISLKESVRKQSAVDANSRQFQFKLKTEEMVEYNKSKFEELRRKSDKMREDIIAEIKKMVREQSVIAGYHLVLDSSSKGLSGVDGIVYSSPYIDLTKSVLEKLNGSASK